MFEARKVTESRNRVMMLQIAHTSTSTMDILQTKSNLGTTMHNRDTGSLSLGVTGRTLIGSPASGLASRLAHAQVAALGVSAASLISGNIGTRTEDLNLGNLISETGSMSNEARLAWTDIPQSCLSLWRKQYLMPQQCPWHKSLLQSTPRCDNGGHASLDKRSNGRPSPWGTNPC